MRDQLVAGGRQNVPTTVLADTDPNVTLRLVTIHNRFRAVPVHIPILQE